MPRWIFMWTAAAAAAAVFEKIALKLMKMMEDE